MDSGHAAARHARESWIQGWIRGVDSGIRGWQEDASPGARDAEEAGMRVERVPLDQLQGLLYGGAALGPTIAVRSSAPPRPYRPALCFAAAAQAGHAAGRWWLLTQRLHAALARGATWL